MFSNLEVMIAIRYLGSRRQEGFISISAWFSLIGITLGVATLIVVALSLAEIPVEIPFLASIETVKAV